MKLPALTPRLDTIARLIPNCRCFADIGTDHAYLPVFMCMSGIADTAIASDIKKGPLLRAEKTVSDFNLNDKICLRLGAGVDTLEKDEADTVAIAGMGGLVIAEILRAGIDKLTSLKALILQPMTADSELREFLINNGWTIKEEHLAKEDDKIYNILSVVWSGKNESYSPLELYLGKQLIENKPEHFNEYLLKRTKKLNNMVDGLKASKSAESKKKLFECMTLLKEIEERALCIK